ncbi:elongation factor G, putative [Plasmodium knowlesi strain H]|uniref:Elongation factor G, putative n=2 Tax=Plasmodium knowlesi TaxID=5850 RepID=B3L839_PLAKH|nr:elongation factor G, putative [Plasmodium knowlesi strain H]OTN64547.1 putative Elongation factor G [Plasmodium knowlesi]CAA9989310.1 elongation factor G, putative [Plasmodium knowlesi strain H]VVS78784.1 elongation factor G, putative [Plasmodium knowlesi strain H]|eukprot:XP_002261657.1 Elongation factor G, putative [Plasmodium knowlesi strain H]
MFKLFLWKGQDALVLLVLLFLFIKWSSDTVVSALSRYRRKDGGVIQRWSKPSVPSFLMNGDYARRSIFKSQKIKQNKMNTFRLMISSVCGNKNVELENYRNIGIIAHIDAGKTTTTERILYYTNVIKKIGEVHEGMSTMDYLDIEREKGITINAAVTACYWNGSEKNLGDYRINIIDTPGHVDFTAEVEKSLRVLDGGVVVFDSSEGVESQSETVWKQANRYNISRIIFLNKLDKVGANFESCIEEIKRKLNKRILILFVPVFEMTNFVSTIDILREKIILYKNAHEFVYKDIPKSHYDIFLKYKNLLFEEIAEKYNSFLDMYLNDKPIQVEEVEQYIRKLVVEEKYNVVMCGSSLKNKNVHMLLDAVVKYLPSPIDSIQNYKNQIIFKHDVNKRGEKISPIELPTGGVKEQSSPSTGELSTSGEERISDKGTMQEEGKCNAAKSNDNISEELNQMNIKNFKRKVVALIYKIMNDQHLGNINYVRIYEGQINRGDYIYNNRTKKSEKISKIFFIHSSEKYELECARAGDIVGLVGLKDTQIGDTLSSTFLRAELKKIKEIPPIISFYIYNKNKNEYEKLINALMKIKKEDHSFFYHINPDTKDLLISGVGELHLQIIINKIEKDFNIPIIYGQPQISYKETFVENVEARGKYIKQSGGRGQYGDVHIKIEPMYSYAEEEEDEEGENANGESQNDGENSKKVDNSSNEQDSHKNSMNIDTSEVNNNIIIKNEITCGAIPSAYFDAIYTGIREQCNLGVLSNSPLINIIVRIVDGSFHPVDSNEHAFKLAAGIAIREAARKASVRLLEPMMNLNVSVPTEYLGEVISDLVKKRGKIQHIDESDEHTKEIVARAPMASILSYVSDLRKITKGRGNYTMTLHKYALVPQYIQEQILQKKE